MTRLRDLDDDLVVSLPEGFVPGTVAPFMMRYGTGFLVAMQRAVDVPPTDGARVHGEPA